MTLRTAAAILLAIATPALAADPQLTLHLDREKCKVNPNFYGLMTEEINYSYDGGLYGELLRNRILKDGAKEATHWTIWKSDGATASIALEKQGPTQILDAALKLDASNLTAGQTASIVNDGYWGIPVKPSTTYKASFRVRADAAFTGPLTVSLQSADGKTTYARADVSGITADWSELKADLSTAPDAKPTTDARFVITAAAPATLHFSLLSLFPPTFGNRPNGNRVDLMQMLVDMKPAFLRFPGGNYLEGDYFNERFDWKKTLGPISGRAGHRSPWGYRSTDGMGLLEFLYWCEEMRAEPVLAVFAGYALKHDYVPAGADLQPYVDEALEEIEYVSGDVNTKWGAKRAADGHPAPFKLRYVEIGNEDWFDRSGSYDGRYAQFHDAIKAKHPDLQLIATTGVKSRVPDLIDEHYYWSDPHAAQASAHKYDNRPRDAKTKIFVGEWATRQGAPTTNLNSALSDAAFLTGLERNADIVVMSCFAPLFVNATRVDGKLVGQQWPSDLIGYDNLTSYGSPSYHVQKLFNTHLGDAVIAGELTGVATLTPPPPPPSTRPNARKPAPLGPIDQLYYSATKSSDAGLIHLKVVNLSAGPTPLHIELAGAKDISPTATAWTVSSADPQDTNALTDPNKITPVESKVEGVSASFTHAFPPHSVTVLDIAAK